MAIAPPGTEGPNRSLSPADLMPRRQPSLIRRISEFFFHANPRTGPQPQDQNTTETGIVSEGLVSLYDRQFKFDVTRRATYKDVEEIDQASEEASVALDTITNNVTTSDDGVQMSFQVFARNPKVLNILDEVIAICKLHERVRPMVRNLVKYGDMFAETVINENGEVVDVKQLPPITMFRNEDLTGNLILGEPRYDKKSGKVLNGSEECAFEQKAESTGAMLATFWPWQVIHIRLNHDGFSPYGKSHLRVARITYKKLKALEESLIVGRLTRDILKLVFYVDTTGLPPNERRRALQDFQMAVMQRMHVDGRRENPFSVMTDFFVSSGWIKLGQQIQPMQTKVDVIDPKNVGIHDITDIEYLHRKFTAALRVPRAHLGFEKDINSKSTLCLTGDTKISLLDGREVPIIDLVQEYNDGKENWVYSVDQKTLKIKPGKIEWAAQTSPLRQVWKVILDSGESFRATATHPCMMRDGTYRPVADLRVGDGLMPLYRKVSSKEIKDELEGYEMIQEPSTGVWNYTHRVVKSANSWASVRHHKDSDVSKTTSIINHKIIAIEYAGEEPVYDITVGEWHNFALTVGIFVHNSIQDVQYVRFLRDIQQIIGQGLKQLFDIALILADIDPEQTEYEISWPALSAVDQVNAAQSELYRAQAHAIYANPPFDAIDGRWAQQHVFNMNDEEMDEIEERIEQAQAEAQAQALAIAQAQPSSQVPGKPAPGKPKTAAISTAGKSPKDQGQGKVLPNPTGYKRTAKDKQTQSRYSRHDPGDNDMPPTPNPDGVKSTTAEIGVDKSAALLQALYQTTDEIDKDLTRLAYKLQGSINGRSNGHTSSN